MPYRHLRLIAFLIGSIIFCTCIDPYYPELGGYESLLVVDGLITNANASYTVKLSRTVKDSREIQQDVTDAQLYISESNGARHELTNRGMGIYKTDSTVFTGHPGETYTLHILADGREYESDPCLMMPVPAMDSVYYIRDTEMTNNGTEINEGIRILVDSKDAGELDNLRWDYEETWKFKVPTPKKFNYISDTNIIPIQDVREYCWKSRNSDELIIRSAAESGTGSLAKVPINFIATGKSDRLLLQYSILVRQYSLSAGEYDFWKNMKTVNETTGDIFAAQPFPVKSNIHNVNNQGEKVLGYFQVSAVNEIRKEILFSDIVGYDLPLYKNPCKRIEMAPWDYPMSGWAKPLTWDDLHYMYVTSGYYFVEPRYTSGTYELQKLVFALPECADCTETGTMIKPNYWTDKY